MIRLYLAGPEVFHRDAVQLGMAKQLLCARFHYQGLYPLDGAAAADKPADPRAIYERCVTLMHQADAGIFNLSPFRGPSADVGTVLELGVMAAMGKPVFAYTHAAEDLDRAPAREPRPHPGCRDRDVARPRRPRRRGLWPCRQPDARRDVGEPGPQGATVSACRRASASPASTASSPCLQEVREALPAIPRG